MKPVGTKLEVWKGQAEKTSGGLSKSDLKQSKDGSIVSRDKSTAEKKNPWIVATQKAYKKMIENGSIKKGDQVILNKGKEGKEWYENAKSIYGK